MSLLRTTLRSSRALPTLPAGRRTVFFANYKLTSTDPPSMQEQQQQALEPSSKPTTELEEVRQSQNTKNLWKKIDPHFQDMPHHEREAITNILQTAMRGDWKQMSVDEKKAAYYIAYGPWGARQPTGSPLKTAALMWCFYIGIAASGIIWNINRYMVPPPPRTMTREWQEATNAKMIERNMNPITGISSEGYKGRGYIQEW